jgi:cellobiose transport system permease protein
MICIALVLAAMMNAVVHAKTFYRVTFFIPNVTSVVAMAIFFGAVFGTQFGLINVILHALHLPVVDWLKNAWGIKVTIAALMTWQWTGYNAIIYLAGLQTIPKELYEAAHIDGAGPVKTFLRITLPLLRPIILFTVVVSTITGMQSFTEAQVMVNTGGALNPDSGGPGQAGLTMVLYLYQQAFDFSDYGYGAAISWAIFLIVATFAVINWRLVSRNED